jgi:glycogen debranching enzyme
MEKLSAILLLISLSLSSINLNCFQTKGDKGMYFAKKAYTDTPLPKFENDKDKIPMPILDSDPGWLDMYWKCWELAMNKAKKPYRGSPFVSNYIDEAFSDNIFQWDTHFMLMFWNYIYYIFPAIESHDNFYCRQHSDGYICREIHEKNGEDFYYDGKDNNTLTNTINPPLFPWVEYEYYKISGDDSRFKLIIPVLEKYGDWIDNNRIKPGTKHGLYWQTGLGSGMDNTPRSGSGWVCISSQMAMFYLYLGKICEHEKAEAKANKFYSRSKAIAKKINQCMWNEEDGLYYDVADNGEQVTVKTAASFWPMLAEICSNEQASRLVENLKDPKTFWRPFPFPTLSADHPDFNPKGHYWVGGVWAPTNYMIIKGLQKYGFQEFAAEATEKYLNGMYEVFKKTGTVWENYAPESFNPGDIAKGDFVGWTGLGPISLLIENVIGIQLDALNNTIHWHLNRTDRYGILNFYFCNAIVSMISEKRLDKNAAAKISIESNKALTVKLYNRGRKKSFKISPGENLIEF